MTDEVNCFLEVFHDEIRSDFPFAHVAPVFTAGENKDRSAPGIMAGLDVGFSISDEECLLGRTDADLHERKRALEIPDPGFAAITARIGLMRAIKTAFDTAAGLGDILEHVIIDALELCFGEDPFADPGLIRDDEYLVAHLGELAYRIDRPGDKTELLDLGHVVAVAGKFINNAVAV